MYDAFFARAAQANKTVKRSDSTKKSSVKKKASKAVNISVAVIGGGISGLVCANRLKQLGVSHVVCFDTGQRACGGRCSSRVLPVGNPNAGGAVNNVVQHVCDHAAQYFTVTDARFERLVGVLIILFTVVCGFSVFVPASGSSQTSFQCLVRTRMVQKKCSVLR